jgi:hypothetical protein
VPAVGAFQRLHGLYPAVSAASIAPRRRGSESKIEGIENYSAPVGAFLALALVPHHVVHPGAGCCLQARELPTAGAELVGRSERGRTVDYVSHEFYRVADGAIAEEWVCSDTGSLFRQPG